VINKVGTGTNITLGDKARRQRTDNRGQRFWISDLDSYNLGIGISDFGLPAHGAKRIALSVEYFRNFRIVDLYALRYDLCP
jgi:hypothetical protein